MPVLRRGQGDSLPVQEVSAGKEHSGCGTQWVWALAPPQCAALWILRAEGTYLGFASCREPEHPDDKER